MYNEKEESFYSDLKAISEASESIRDSIQTINIDSLELIKNYLNNIDTNKAIASMSNSLNAITKAYENSVSSLGVSSIITNINNYAESFSNVLANACNISTAFSEAISKSIINNNYSSFISSINDVLKKDYINSLDFAFIKKADLLSNYQSIEVPSGLKKSIKDLNKYSADRLSNTTGIAYDTTCNQFVNRDSERASLSTSKEMNIVCSSMYLFDEYEEEFVSENELMDFISFLDENRSFACENETGQKIYKFIEQLDKIIDFDKGKYYHARIRNKSDYPFTYSEMLCAPTGIMNPGRYNNPGQSFYYFSDQIDGCCKEVGKKDDSVIQIAEIQPNKNIRMIDLSGSIKYANTLLRYIRFPKDDKPVPKVYLLPCYISDCCRKAGIEGIKYRGSNEYSNYVCWNSGYFKFIKMHEK